MRSERKRTTAGDPAKDTMRAVVQDRYGSADVLRIAQVARPSPGAEQVLLRVHAAGLDRGTWHLMAGKPYAVRLAIGIRRPRQPVPGKDVAGVVIAVGAAVTRFAVGDEVYGIGVGTFADLTVAKQDKLDRKPTNLTFAQAAVVPVSGITALRAVTDLGRVRPGHKVLILGASGGVGSYAVQIAKAYGAEVTGVCSAAKADLVRALGADHVLDYAREDFADGRQRYDVILDIAGNPTLPRLRRALTPTGTAVLVGGEDGDRLTGMNRQLLALARAPFIRQRVALLTAQERATHIERLTALIEAGKVTPSVDRTYPLEQAPEAMRLLEAGQVRGKIAITI
jgi:NADPH:quinone reductase-like Zn-dependent oxidoreductase